ncbi:glutathione S-transferase A4 [Pteropus alecto]|uniref:glutathione S-transferase A4 n=1 Tax=Pteropus alecto TaxID=9402 RepID=UPI000D5378BD|nr:glutathione S-transferase A4 [Pteropus alecto]
MEEWGSEKQTYLYVPIRKALFNSQNPEPEVMVAKPKLYYFRGRGRMESIRWLLAAAGVELGSLVGKEGGLKKNFLKQESSMRSCRRILKDHGEDFLVGNKFSWADIQLLETILMVEELNASVLSDFPLLKAFKTRISNIPTIKKFLQLGSQKKLPPDSHYVEVVRNILQF